MNKTKQDEIDMYEEIEDAEFFKFESIGDKIEGMLTDKSRSQRYGFGMYNVMTKDGERKRFHGTTQLDTLMDAIEIQDYIQIELIELQETKAGDMKIFKVRRKKE